MKGRGEREGGREGRKFHSLHGDADGRPERGPWKGGGGLLLFSLLILG